MAIAARYHDGLTADVHIVGLDYEAEALVIRDADHVEIARWKAGDLYALHGRKDELRLGAIGLPQGARLVIAGRDNVARVLATIPALSAHRWRETGREIRLAVTATLAMASVILAYLYGVPLLSGRLAAMVPVAWEARLGETVAQQMEASVEGESGFELCDPNPNSLANKAIARFGAEALAGSRSPFDLDIRVVKSDIPNAFALPGGQVFVFSALLDKAQSQDEFAGVLHMKSATSPIGTAWSG